MALIRSPAVIFTVLIFFFFGPSVEGRFGVSQKMVGARSEIGDVKTNEEVQKLGRFSVDEYNQRRISMVGNDNGGGGGGGDRLRFVEVVEAERQVVAGIKYYLKVSAETEKSAENGGGTTRTFDSIVVVKPWMKSKQLIGFKPSNDRHVVH